MIVGGEYRQYRGGGMSHGCEAGMGGGGGPSTGWHGARDSSQCRLSKYCIKAEICSLDSYAEYLHSIQKYFKHFSVAV